MSFEGELGDALPLSRDAWLAAPTDRSNRRSYARRLATLGEFEQVLELNGNDFHPRALSALSRTEEATILAYDLAASGEDIASLIRLLHLEGRHEELIGFVESRWPDLDAWQRDFPGRFGVGDLNLARITHAYRTLGNDEVFSDAMQRLQKNLMFQRSQGADNFVLLASEAYYHMLAGHEDEALNSLAQTIDRGMITRPRMADDWPVFRPLEGDPRYEAIQQRMIDHLNIERAKAGLDPVALDRVL